MRTRTIGSNGLVALALLTGLAACSGTTTIYKTVPGEAPPDETTTPDAPANTPDPSMTGDPTSKDTPAPPIGVSRELGQQFDNHAFALG